jgi:ArsR family transcriptional regulator
MREIIKSLKSLSDETRIRILKLLLLQECCVCEVMQALDISQTRASRNLAVLYDAGFLKLRREGLWSYYSIDFENLKPYQLDLIEAIKKATDRNSLVAHDEERLKYATRTGSGCAVKSG